MHKENSLLLIEIYNKLLNHFGKQNWWPIIGSKKTKRLEIIIGAILTQNTSWKNVEKAIKNLVEKRLISREKIIKIKEEELENIIKPCGYYRQKAKRLKEALKRIKGNVTREKLLKINGIGKETCDAILLYAYEKPYFVIDAYTRRILERTGILKNAFKMGYDELQRFFHENLPKDIEVYKEYHALLDELAKNYCKKKSPLCEKCPIVAICDFGMNSRSKNKR
ncbi:MAG: endonuclease [Candidatus Aenigmatarchaeota archaeon]